MKRSFETLVNIHKQYGFINLSGCFHRVFSNPKKDKTAERKSFDSGQQKGATFLWSSLQLPGNKSLNTLSSIFLSSVFLKVNALFTSISSLCSEFTDVLLGVLCWPCCDLSRLSACLSPPTASHRHKHKSV